MGQAWMLRLALEHGTGTEFVFANKQKRAILLHPEFDFRRLGFFLNYDYGGFAWA